MAIRLLKIVFIVFISLLCLFYAAQNVANLDACYQAFAYVMGAEDHQVYPDSIFPAIQGSIIIQLTQPTGPHRMRSTALERARLLQELTDRQVVNHAAGPVHADDQKEGHRQQHTATENHEFQSPTIHLPKILAFFGLFAPPQAHRNQP